MPLHFQGSNRVLRLEARAGFVLSGTLAEQASLQSQRVSRIDTPPSLLRPLPLGCAASTTHLYASVTDTARDADPASLCFRNARSGLQHFSKMRLCWSSCAAYSECVYPVAIRLVADPLTVTCRLQGSLCKPQQPGSFPLGCVESSCGLLQPQVPVLTCLPTRPLQAVVKGETSWGQIFAWVCAYLMKLNVACG